MKYLSSTIIFVHNFTLKITSARARIRARLNKGPVVSLVEKNKGPGYKTSKYGKCIQGAMIPSTRFTLKQFESLRDATLI